MSSIIIPAPVDMHVHFRQDDLLKRVSHQHTKIFEYSLAMPNTTPPIIDWETATMYRDTFSCPEKVKVALKLLPDTIPDTIIRAHQNGFKYIKVYPQGATHNSNDGIPYEDIAHLSPRFRNQLETMQSLGTICGFHGEDPNAYYIDMEEAFLPTLNKIATAFPKLKIVLEHISTRAAILAVKHYPNVACTVTLHHLAITGDDVAKHKLHPHNFCRPIVQRPEDRRALLEFVLSQHRRCFFGSDSAPHEMGSKECSDGCPGIYSAPILLPGLAHFIKTGIGFTTNSKLSDVLTSFTSVNPREWYGLPAPLDTIRLVEETWPVLEAYDGLVPFWAGKNLTWKLIKESKQ